MQILLFLYNIIILLLTPIGFIVGLIYVLIKKDIGHYFERFGFIKLPAIKGETIWLHAASVGEVRSAERLIESLRQRFTGVNIIVTTMTTNGLKVAKHNENIDYTFLMPIENIPAFKYIIFNLNVKLLIIIDTEIWPNLIHTADLYCKLILVNARISDKAYGSYSRFKFIFKPFLKKFSAILTKSDIDLQRFKYILGNDKSILNIGDIKFQARKSAKDIEPLYEGGRYVVAASTHADEEALIIKAFEEVADRFDKLIIAPRHIERAADIRKLTKSCKVEVIDKFGMLERLYINADKIFIGGSLADVGGHNIYEALQFSKCIAVGEHMYNFKEIYELAKSYDLVTDLRTHEDIVNWLKSEESEKKFEDFFAIVDKNNKNILDKIGELVASILRI